MDINSQINELIHDILDGITKELNKYWTSIKKEYGILDKEMFPLYIHTPDQIISIMFNEEIPHDLELFMNLFKSRSISTVTLPVFEHDIITKNRGITMIPVSYLWNLINCCQYNLDDTLASVKFRLRHEIGIIINCRNHSIGKKEDDYTQFLEDNQRSLFVFEKYYNAEEIGELEYMLKRRESVYMEKAADKIVGITKQDIIDDYHRINQLNI